MADPSKLLTPADLSDLKAKAKAATPGPWVARSQMTGERMFLVISQDRAAICDCFRMVDQENIAAAKAKGEIKFAVVMDDKIIKITMPWALLTTTDEAGIAEWILAQMREERTNA